MEKARLSLRNRLSRWNQQQHTWDWNLEELAKEVLEDSHGGRSNLTSTLLDEMPQARPSPSLSGWMAIKCFLSSLPKESKCWTSFCVQPKDVCSDSPKDEELILAIQILYLCICLFAEMYV